MAGSYSDTRITHRVGEVEPAGQYDPGGQRPLQFDTVNPVALP